MSKPPLTQKEAVILRDHLQMDWKSRIDEAVKLFNEGKMRIVCAPSSWPRSGSKVEATVCEHRCAVCDCEVMVAPYTLAVLAQVEVPQVWCADCILKEIKSGSITKTEN